MDKIGTKDTRKTHTAYHRKAWRVISQEKKSLWYWAIDLHQETLWTILRKEMEIHNLIQQVGEDFLKAEEIKLT